MNEYHSDIVRLYSVFFKSYNKVGKCCLMIPEFYSVNLFVMLSWCDSVCVYIYIYTQLLNWPKGFLRI